MPRSHQGLHYPNAFRRDLWNGTQWRDKFPDTLRITFSSWVGTYGLLYNLSGPLDIPVDPDDPSQMLINWSGRLRVAGTPACIFQCQAEVNPTTRVIDIDITMDFVGGPHVHGHQPFVFWVGPAPWNTSWTTGLGGTMTTSDPTKFRANAPSIAIIRMTGQPY